MGRHSTGEAPDAPPPAADIRILGGSPDAAEIAAVTAVLSAALDQIASEDRRRHESAPSAWAASQRGLRTPIADRRWSWFSPR